MFNNVKIGEKTVPMLSMASVDIYYKNIFHEDPIALQTADNLEVGTMINFVSRMGFVMAKFAELKDRKEMAKLNEEAFIDWMDQFERADLTDALQDIQATYEGQNITGSTAKKNSGESTAT